MPSREKRYFSAPDTITSEKNYRKYLWICENLLSAPEIPGFMFPNYYFYFEATVNPEFDDNFKNLVRQIDNCLIRQNGAKSRTSQLNLIRIEDANNRCTRSLTTGAFAEIDLYDGLAASGGEKKTECYNFSIILDI